MHEDLFIGDLHQIVVASDDARTTTGRVRAGEDGGPQDQRGGAVQDARRPRLLPGRAVPEGAPVEAQRRVLEVLYLVAREFLANYEFFWFSRLEAMRHNPKRPKTIPKSTRPLSRLFKTRE